MYPASVSGQKDNNNVSFAFKCRSGRDSGAYFALVGRGVNIEYGFGGGGGGGVLYENKTDQLLNLDRFQLKTVNNVSNWFSRNS